jgi:hypothetical protein
VGGTLLKNIIYVASFLSAATAYANVDLTEPTTNFVSLFEELVVGTRLDDIFINFQYGASNFNTTSSTFSSGFVNSFTSLAIVGTGTGATAFAQLSSIDPLRYRPGHEAELFFTAMFPNGAAAGSTQWIGIFDSLNGIAVGYNGTTFSILLRSNGIDTIVPQVSFNKDTLDGTGISGFTLDTEFLNVFRIAYGWLGASPITLSILDQNGNWVTFHEFINNNVSAAPSFRNPYLPVTMQVNKTSGASDVRIASAGWNTQVVAERPSASIRSFSANGSVRQTSVGTPEQNFLTLRNKSTFQGAPNKIKLRVTSVSFAENNILNEGFIIRLKKGATVTGLSFSDVNTNNSIAEVSSAGNYVAGTGTLLFAQGGPDNLPTFLNFNLLPPNDLLIELAPGEQITITVQETVSGQTVSGFGGLTWEELF